jgi:hypothetical protein
MCYGVAVLHRCCIRGCHLAVLARFAANMQLRKCRCRGGLQAYYLVLMSQGETAIG